MAVSKKERTPRQKTKRFWAIMGIYALVVLILMAIGLWFFWDYLAAFEASRPEGVIKAYMETATPEVLSAKDTKTLEAVDRTLQSEEAARKVIADSLQSPITYAKNTKLSDDSQLVYMILCGGKTIGKVTMTVEKTDDYDFQYWAVHSDEYDFSYLLGDSVSITVPEEFSVYADGVLLTKDYITESDIHYTSVEKYYKDYRLPTLCTYTTNPVLGTPVLTVKDAAGAEVAIDENTDLEQFLQNCSDQELADMNTFLEGYIPSYVDFISVTGGQGAMQRNLNNLKKWMVPNGELAKRMADTTAALLWVTDRRASVSAITLGRCLRLEEGRYLCDVTYVVDTRDHTGKVEVTNHIDLIVVATDAGLRAESMISH